MRISDWSSDVCSSDLSCAAPRWWCGRCATGATPPTASTITSPHGPTRLPPNRPAPRITVPPTVTPTVPPPEEARAMTDMQQDGPLESGEQFVRAWRANAATLQAGHAYDPAQEHDACGVGFIASIDRKST